MIRGLYTSGWSMIANSKKMDVISNNLANASTNAFKKDTVVFQSFPEALTQRLNDTNGKANLSGQIGKMELGSDVGQIFTYYNQGQTAKTGNNMDLSLKDDGSSFFTVAVTQPNGEESECYTRDGAFTLNADGKLVTKDGYEVKGVDGSIILKNEDFTVASDGTITQDGVNVGKLLIKSFTDTSTLRKFGNNYVNATEQSEEGEFKGTVIQGYIEQSNVNIIKEMVDMINVTRSYETNQKLLQAQDGTLEKAVNEVGVVK